MGWYETLRQVLAPPTPFTSQGIVARRDVVVVDRCSLPHTCPTCGTSWETTPASSLGDSGRTGGSDG